MREIDYSKVLSNIDMMINTLEFDAMRSAGKAKQAVLELDALYNMKAIYEKKLSKPTPTKKEV